MTEDRLPLAELLAKAGDGDFLRSVAEAVVKLLMETDVEGPDRRRASRAHGRPRDLPQWLPGPDAGHAAGELAAADPQAAARQLLPAVPGAAQDVGEGLGSRHPGGVDRRRVDPAGLTTWCRAMGLSGISKSTVSKLCKDIDDRVNAFLERPLVGDWPYLWLDATYPTAGTCCAISAMPSVPWSTATTAISTAPPSRWTSLPPRRRQMRHPLNLPSA